MNVSHRCLINQKLFSDVCFIINNKQKIYAHTYLLQVRTPSPCLMLQKGVKKSRRSGSGRLQLLLAKEHITSSVMLLLLEYIYTGDIPFQNLAPFDVLSLLHAGREYNIDRLIFLCEMYLYKCLSLDSVFQVLKIANDFHDEEVINFCIEFMCKHHTDIVKNKDGINLIGLDLYQRVITAYLKYETAEAASSASGTNPAATAAAGLRRKLRSEIFRWQSIYTDKFQHPPPNTAVADFTKLFREMPDSDLQVLLHGQQVPCHKAILAAHSNLFSLLLYNNSKKDKDKNVIQLPLGGPSIAAFRQLLQYLYYGDEAIPALLAVELIPISHKYGIPGLQSHCEALLPDQVRLDTAIPILQVSYFSPSKESQLMRTRSLEFISLHLADLDVVPLMSLEPNRMIYDVLAVVKEAMLAQKIRLPSQGAPQKEPVTAPAVQPASPAPEKGVTWFDDQMSTSTSSLDTTILSTSSKQFFDTIRSLQSPSPEPISPFLLFKEQYSTYAQENGRDPSQTNRPVSPKSHLHAVVDSAEESETEETEEEREEREAAERKARRERERMEELEKDMEEEVKNKEAVVFAKLHKARSMSISATVVFQEALSQAAPASPAVPLQLDEHGDFEELDLGSPIKPTSGHSTPDAPEGGRRQQSSFGHDSMMAFDQMIAELCTTPDCAAPIDVPAETSGEEMYTFDEDSDESDASTSDDEPEAASEVLKRLLETMDPHDEEWKEILASMDHLKLSYQELMQEYTSVKARKGKTKRTNTYAETHLEK
eukprot:TRINITY_DN5588_c0_g1_i3.p1 TRINITY_DN5588_c0_g1~~TRINITY_DN5588_c0_g1_i3.p1  ORF type:complete len:766 (+),score=222.09 TRINITY_DN5588_c0_g1_i3:119-2416(+)